MDDPFLRSRQSLAGDGARTWLLAAAGVAMLLVAWGAWFGLARVSVYAVSDQARLEAAGAAQQVQAPAAGRVIAQLVELGDSVVEGQVLFEIGAEVEEALEAEERGRLDSVRAQRRPLEEQLRLDSQAQDDERRAARAARAEARARVQASEAAAAFAEAHAARQEGLYRNGLLSESERSAAEAQARQERAAAEAGQQALRSLESQHQAAEQGRQAKLAELERLLERLRGEEQEIAAALEGRSAEVARRKVLAPVDGQVAEIDAELGPGAVLEAGDHLATVVPPGKVGVVAHFAPGDALGRIRPGQKCRLRLEGFSWMRYGVLTAEVTRVASEVRSGGVRVEAALIDDASSAIPLEHGLPGVLEVEVERASPAALALRAAGRRLGPVRRTGPGAGRDAVQGEPDPEG